MMEKTVLIATRAPDDDNNKKLGLSQKTNKLHTRNQLLFTHETITRTHKTKLNDFYLKN